MLDIYSSLTRAGISSPENYLTEAFVYLVKLLLERHPEQGLQILNCLCDLPKKLSDPNEVQIFTQSSYESGRPDIEIRAFDTIVFVEVKHDSGLGVDQLERYNAELRRMDVSIRRLVFLTRSLLDAQQTTLEQDKFHHVCWYEIHSWLTSLINSILFTDEVCRFFVQDFLTFLEGKNMALKKVTWEYMQGLPAFVNLINMIETALIKAAPSSKMKKSAGWSWMGFYIDSQYFVAVRYEQPLFIVFQNHMGNNPSYDRYFDLEKEHFFALTQGEQFEALVSFFQQALDDAPLESGPPPTPLPPEEETIE